MSFRSRMLVTVVAVAVAAFATGLALGRYAVPSGQPKGTAITVADGVTVYMSGRGLAAYRRRNANSLAMARLRAAIPALEAWRADHNTYAGATLARLREYDAGVVGVSVVFATRDDYCLESRVGDAVASKSGPAASPAFSACGR